MTRDIEFTRPCRKMKDKCPVCGGYEEVLGAHWNQSCEYPEIPEWVHESFTGMVMGDGSVGDRDGTRNPQINICMTNKVFLNWYSKATNTFTCSVNDGPSAEYLAESSRRNGMNPSATAEDYNDQYVLTTRSMPEINKYSKWYDTGKKVFPESIELTPRVLKYWYVCDGGMVWQNFTTGCPLIGATNENGNKDKIIGMFDDIGFNVGFSSEAIRIKESEKNKFLDYMGEPLPGFEYKWEVGDRRRYEMLKEDVYS